MKSSLHLNNCSSHLSKTLRRKCSVSLVQTSTWNRCRLVSLDAAKKMSPRIASSSVNSRAKLFSVTWMWWRWNTPAIVDNCTWSTKHSQWHLQCSSWQAIQVNYTNYFSFWRCINCLTFNQFLISSGWKTFKIDLKLRDSQTELL